MSQQKVLYKTVRFRRGGTNASRPTLNSADDLGQVLTLSVNRENEEAVFEKASGGRWGDYDAINQRERVTYAVTIGELSEVSHELVHAVSVSLSGGGATAVPGSNVTTKGWVQILLTDETQATVVDSTFWCKADISSAEYPQSGYTQASFTFRKLESTQNQVIFATVA